MKLTHLIVAAVAVIGLSLTVQAASAGSVVLDGSALKTQPGRGLTLIHMHSSSSGGPGSYHPSFSYPHSPGMGTHPSWSGVHPNWTGTHPNWKSVHPNWTGMHHHRHDGRRGYWRHGHWYGYGYGGIGGDSCYPECLAEGYSPAYCTANAYAFCW